MPKVSFYLRNEDVEAWKAIDKKTAWIHEQLHEYELDDPLTKADAERLLSGANPRTTLNQVKEYAAKSPGGMFDRTIDTCKHGVDKKFCVKGCK